MAQKKTDWYCKKDGSESKPLTAGKLRQLACEGKLKRDDLVRRGDSENWVRAGTVKGLFDDAKLRLTTEATDPVESEIIQELTLEPPRPLATSPQHRKVASVGPPPQSPWANPKHRLTLTVRFDNATTRTLVRHDGQPVVIARRDRQCLVVSRREKDEFRDWINIQNATIREAFRGCQSVRIYNPEQTQIGTIDGGKVDIQGQLIASYITGAEQEMAIKRQQMLQMLGTFGVGGLLFFGTLMVSPPDRGGGSGGSALPMIVVVLTVLAAIVQGVVNLGNWLDERGTKPKVLFKSKANEKLVAVFNSKRTESVVANWVEIDAGCPHVSLVLLLTLLHTFDAPVDRAVNSSRETEYVFEVGGEVVL